MVRLHIVRSAPEAHIVRTALAHAGIDALVQNDQQIPTGAEGDNWVEIWVDEERAEEAVEFLKSVVRTDETGRLSLIDPADPEGRLTLSPEAGNVALAPTHCEACGAEWEPGFEVCWSCLAELPDAP